MKKSMLMATALLSVACANAQEKEYPKQEEMRPGMSEYWTPQRKVVTPGNERTNSAPSDAIVLFDGKDLSEWTNGDGNEPKWTVKNGTVTVAKDAGDIVTKRKFRNFQLHIEWTAPTKVEGESQGRGNSGVFLQDKYEVQVLDCYENETYINGMTGSIYKQTPPLVNAMRKPGEWNVYDIIYTAPIFKEDGTYLYHPYVTVIQNGIVLQNHTEIWGTTEYIGWPQTIKHEDGPIRLQNHGNPVSYRNIWIREL